MSNAYFQFRQFTVRHDLCAMKVGTDGVLLGAWAPFRQPSTILDVGTGSGLIALMLAQRFPKASLTAIDIDASAVAQATANVAASPFASRIAVVHTSLQHFASQPASPSHRCEAALTSSPSQSDSHRCEAAPFSAIVCNPPFFENSLLAPDPSRRTARHATELTLDSLASTSASLLAEGGQLAIVVPTDAFERLRHLCFASGLALEAACHVQTTPRKAPKRTLALFCKGQTEAPSISTLLLTVDGQRSPEYAALTADFYL